MIHKIAMITPWPEERTGIADYAYDLAIGLSHSGIEVDVFTTCQQPVSGARNITIRNIDRFPGGQAYDEIVYQMGNCSTFHGDQLPVLAEHPGVVHLHDPSLHHLIAFFLYRDDVRSYYQVLRSWYGPQVSAWIQQYNTEHDHSFWDSAYVSEVPFFDPVLEFATGCIVHSEFAQKAIRRRFPELVAYKLPQVYRNMHPSRRASSEHAVLHVGVFGLVQPHKHVDIVLEAVKACNTDSARVHLHVGGVLEGSCKSLPDLAISLGIEADVTFYGRMSEEAFLAKMREIDVCVSLRFPTMGETSAVVSRAMQLGLPTIVNDVGWYAELPDCVVKLPLEKSEMRIRLIKELTSLSENRERLEQWTRQCHQYATTACSFEKGVQEYLHVLQRLGASAPLRLAS